MYFVLINAQLHVNFYADHHFSKTDSLHFQITPTNLTQIYITFGDFDQPLKVVIGRGTADVSVREMT